VFTTPHSSTAVYLHAGSFNPASPLATCFAADNGTINLTVALATGTQYIMVITDDTFAQDGVNFAITMTGPGNIHGQCAEFTDVDLASGFCGNVQWLKNRGVTLGCTATQYCPNDPVSRLQMAAFINRLGTAVQRVVLHAAQSAASATINAGGVVCQTSTYNVDAYRRTATPASVAFYHRAPTAVRVTTQLAYSRDGGANWIPFGQTLRATNAANEYAAQSPAGGAVALVRGQNVMFGILAAPSVATVNDAGCELLMKIDGVTDAIAPFDPRPDAAEAPSGGGR
jgi:hypothetical protein